MKKIIETYLNKLVESFPMVFVKNLDTETIAKAIEDDIKKEYQLITNGKVYEEYEELYIQVFQVEHVGGSFNLGHINSSLFSRYKGKTIEIYVKEAE